MPEVLARNRDLAQSSVYRNLGVLELAGVVHRIVTHDEFARFELAEELSGHHHHHLICSSCGSVEDMELPPTVEAAVTEELARLAERRGFTPSGHQMDLVGVCADCH
jgi:Fe2+ or Zn2+ uptake regulation protein